MALSRLLRPFSLLLICLFWQLASVNSVHFYSDKNKLQFITEPESALTAADDRRVTFKCVVSPSEASIKWLLNGSLINNTTHDWIKISQNKLVIKLQKNTQFGDSIQESLKALGDVMDLQGSVFQCLAELNEQVIVSQPAKLIIAELQPFDEHQESQNISVITGNSAIIPCTLPRSVPLAVAEFEFNNATISYSTDRYRILPSGDLQILNVRHSDSGKYRCIAHNPFLREKLYANYFIYLKVTKSKHASTSLKNLKFILKPKEHISAIIGSNITLECVVNGFPLAKISWTKLNGEISKTRAFVDNGNLIISTIQKSDEGTYTCTAVNNRSTLNADSELQIYEMPQIVNEAYETIQLHEGQEGHLICNAKGKPRPIISWLHNGYFVDSHATKDFSFEKDNAVLRIASANSQLHQGIFQCFATNELGSTYSIKSVMIKSFHSNFPSNFTNHFMIRNSNDTQGTFENSESTDDNSNLDHVDAMSDGSGHKKKPKNLLKLIPPSKPEISRIGDDSVIVRWTVPKSTGLPVSFFKVQYRQDKHPWHTLDSDIPSHQLAYVVCCLKNNSSYRFRIAAVYANDDNKIGKSSKSFTVQNNTKVKAPVHSPTILNASSFTDNEITVKWDLVNIEGVPIDGFLINYRPADTAGDYFTITSMGEKVRQYNITHLTSNTAYEIKMQCFNQGGSSPYSNVYTIKTQGNESKVESTSVETIDPVVPPVQQDTDNNKMQMIAIVVASVTMILGFIVCFVFCIIRPRTQAPALKVAKKDKSLKPPSDYYFTSTNVNNLYDRRANGHLLKSVSNNNNNNNNNNISNTNGCTANHSSENESTPMNTQMNLNNEVPSLSRKNSLRNAMSYSTHQLYSSGNNFKGQNQESTATIDRRRSMKNVANIYLDGTKLNHHSASFTRLNGTLERKRRSRPDLSTLERPYTRNLTHGSESHPNGNVNYFPLSSPIVIMQSSC